jgi:hypothetical protein
MFGWIFANILKPVSSFFGSIFVGQQQQQQQQTAALSGLTQMMIIGFLGLAALTMLKKR